MDRSEAGKLLTPTGTLRAAINIGNAALAKRDEASGVLSGVTVDLATALAAELGVPLQTIVFTGAGKVTDAVGDDVWDIAFLAVDPKRAETLAYSEPYVLIESTYAVPAESKFTSCDQLDHPGAKLVVARNSAYDLYLTQALKHAELVRADAPGTSFKLYREGQFTAVAGVRESLVAALGNDPTMRILPDAIATIKQAMAVSHSRSAAIPLIDDFIDARKRNGFIRRSLDKSGGSDLTIAPPRGGWDA